jgi:hypothetical protein
MHNTEKGRVKVKNRTDMGNMTNVEDRTQASNVMLSWNTVQDYYRRQD